MHTTFVSLLAVVSLVSAGYAPNYVSCPSGTILRQAGAAGPSRGTGNQTLNTEEVAYIQARRQLVPSELQNWLGDRASTVYGGSLNGTNSSNIPNIAIALSGGGDRAALYGAGVLAALDGRNSQSKTVGTGGLLQSSSYISALSGGSWLLTSFVFNDMPDAFDMVLGNNGSQTGWNLDYDLFSPSTTNVSATINWQAQLFRDTAQKRAAGPTFNVTLADIWARALSYHYLPGTSKANFFDNSTDHGASYRWSNVSSVASFSNHTMPFPIIVASVDSPNTTAMPLTGEVIPLQSVVYEITPYEFGSFDPELQSFVPTKYMGTQAMSGTPFGGGGNNQSCVNGFDAACFVTGISSLIFHAYNVSQAVAWTAPASPIYVLVQAVNQTFGATQPNQQLDIAAVPNPFQGVRTSTYEDGTETQLRLVDGGLAGEVDPIAPLAAPSREIDVIVIADATADSAQQMPTGGSLVATEARSLFLPNGSLALPPLPNSVQTYVNLGLNTRPTFFGCEAAPANLTAAVQSAYPLLVYMPNFDPTGTTNTSTGQIQYNVSQQVAFLDAAYNIATQGNSTEWGTCLQCAAVERMRAREGVNRTSACDACFTKYCWNGTEAITNSNNGTAGGNATGSSGGGSNSSSGSGSNSSSGSGSNSSGGSGSTGSTGSTGSSGGKASAAIRSIEGVNVVAGLVAVGLAALIL